ncbi:MAG: hypothetical protein KDJ47_05400 [Hyphomicrobiaceae bacterium]|nr:hypothetical protein [Hyphomicrobiaceae bacterium]
MTKTSKFAAAGAALAFCMLAAPLASTSAAAAPASSVSGMMQAIQSSSAGVVDQVHYRRHWRHRHHCRLVRKCWRRYGHRHCRWVRRCW